MVFLCKFGQNPPIGSGDRVQTRLIFSLYSVVTLKTRSMSPKSNRIFKLPQWYNTKRLARIHHLVQEIGWRQAFLVKIWKFQSACVTLKIRSGSPKSYYFFPRSQLCGCASFVKIHPLVQEIQWATRTPTSGSAPKAICTPSPSVCVCVGGGDIINAYRIEMNKDWIKIKIIECK